MVRPGAARTQALEVTEENPLGLTVDAIPDDVNSLNGFNEVCCVCSPLTIFSPVPPPPTVAGVSPVVASRLRRRASCAGPCLSSGVQERHASELRSSGQ